MNAVNRILRYGGCFFLVFLLVISCTKMDETYHDFWKEGEKVYPASPDSLKSFSGKNRIALEWLNIGDPTIEKTVIYWNNKTDSTAVPIEKREHGIDTIRTVIDSLPEGNYSFDLYSYDKNGNQSVVSNTSGHAYGEGYIRSLLVRIIDNAVYKEGVTTIDWGDPVDTTSIGSEILYTDKNGEAQKVSASPVQESTVINDFDFSPGSTIKHRTLYVPEPTAIDTFYSKYEETPVLGPRTVLPKEGWSATASDYDDRGGRTDRTPEMAIDNNTGTSWVNLVGTSTFPHELTVDMHEQTDDISGISLHVGGSNETPKNMEVYISDDSNEWELMGRFSIKKENGRQYFDFNMPQSFRYFKIDFLDSYGSNNIILNEAGVFIR